MHSTFTLTVLSSKIAKLPSAVPAKRKFFCLLKGKMSKLLQRERLSCQDGLNIHFPQHE